MYGMMMVKFCCQCMVPGGQDAAPLSVAFETRGTQKSEQLSVQPRCLARVSHVWNCEGGASRESVGFVHFHGKESFITKKKKEFIKIK